MERGCHIHLYQERGSHAVDVYQVFPGTYRESAANCGSRSSFLYAPTELQHQPRRRATGKKTLILRIRFLIPKYMVNRICIVSLVVGVLMMIVSCQNSSTFSGDSSGVIIVQTEYDGKWGMVGADGKMLVSDEFKHEPSPVSDGLFTVQEGFYYAIYSIGSNPILMKGCDDLVSVGQYKEGVIPITHERSRITIIDGQGNLKGTLNPIDAKEIIGCSPYCNDGLFYVINEDNKYGFVDKSGNTVIAPIFDYAGMYSDGVALVRKNVNNELTNIVINKNGKELFSLKKDMFPESDYFEHGLLKARNSDDTWGFVDVKGNFIKAKGNVKRIGDYNGESFIFMNNDFLWGVKDMKGDILIRPIYSSVNYLSDSSYLVHTDDKYFVLNSKGNKIHTIEGYDEIWPIEVGVVSYVAKDLSSYKLLKCNGKPVSDNVYYGIGKKDFLLENVVSDYFSYDTIIEELVGSLSDGQYDRYSVNQPVTALGIDNYDSFVNNRFYKNDEPIRKGLKYELKISIIVDDVIASNRYDGYSSHVVINDNAKIETIQITVKTTVNCWKEIAEKLISEISSKGYKLIEKSDLSLVFNGRNNSLTVNSNASGEDVVIKMERINMQENDNFLPIGDNRDSNLKVDSPSVYDAKFFSGKNGYRTTRSGLKYVTLIEGTGSSPKSTDNVKVHYTGRLTDGTVFDTSINREYPPIFPIRSLIKGWNEVLQLMKVGGVAVVYIPSYLAYGTKGAPGTVIGPNADLIFEIQLLGIE